MWLNESMIDILIIPKQFDTYENRWCCFAKTGTYYISSSLMCTMYILFKKQLKFEDYLLSCNYRERISTKYRCANSEIPVYNQLLYISIYVWKLNDVLFDLNVNGDEYHYMGDLRKEPARWRSLLWALDLGLVLHECLPHIPPSGTPIIDSHTLGSCPWMALSTLTLCIIIIMYSA